MLSLFAARLSAQNFEIVFPGLSGTELIDSVASHYRPANVLDYAHARDTLYSKILAKDDDSIRCIYSGHTLYLDPTQDATQYIYQNGGSNGMNTEHAYPQSKGAADGNAHSDMHHLYPARIPVNEARADKPFADIPDAQTDKWFMNNQVSTTIPIQNKDLYAESNENNFEPREASKGDLARSVFYFYTMYRAQANAADPNYFELQRPTLCQWNAQDPADDAELIKTWRIAPYQEGKPNPFVLDCTLANRSWCPETAPVCLLGTSTPARVQPLEMRISPNPATGSNARLDMVLPFSGTLKGRVLSVLGQELSTFQVQNAAAGAFSMPLDLTVLGSTNMGTLYFLETELLGKDRQAKNAVPILVQ